MTCYLQMTTRPSTLMRNLKRVNYSKYLEMKLFSDGDKKIFIHFKLNFQGKSNLQIHYLINCVIMMQVFNVDVTIIRCICTSPTIGVIRLYKNFYHQIRYRIDTFQNFGGQINHLSANQYHQVAAYTCQKYR